MTAEENATDARADWEARIGLPSDTEQTQLPALGAPGWVHADPGRGQVTLSWEPVDGAIGYVVSHSTSPDGPFEAVEVGEPLVRAVPHPPFADTTGRAGVARWYRVSAIAAIGDESQPASVPVLTMPLTDGPARCTVTVDASESGDTRPLHRPWQPMIGSEHLSQLHYGVGSGGRDIGAEFAEALRLAHDELGVRAVRAHSILHDELGVYREVDGRPTYDFSGVDRIYDQLLEIGLKPIVEIGFMPHDLARDPSQIVFEYQAIISPPRDWQRWADLVRAFVAHLADRYGLGELRTWGFEVWNEANLEVFWAGSMEEYLRLYEVTALAVKSVDDALPVGGPASAAVGWLDPLLAHTRSSGAPVDFLSTHTYGNAPLDLRPLAARYGYDGLPLWWTEWGAHATHFNRVHDSVWSAAYLVRGMVSAMDRIDALAYWTISDHFEELGRPSAFLHGGFGLLGVGNVRKPRWWGLWMLAQLGDLRLPVDVSGDGAGDMVNAVAARDDGGGVGILVWNGTVDVGKVAGSPLLDRQVSFVARGLPDGTYRVSHRRLDERHSNLNRTWSQLGDGRDWPTEAQWEALRDADRLEELTPLATVVVADGEIGLDFELPMPALSLIEIVPVAADAGHFRTGSP